MGQSDFALRFKEDRLQSLREDRTFATSAPKQAVEEALFVIPSEARDLLFFSASKKQQIPRANPALRNDRVRVFPQPVKSHSICRTYVAAKATTHKDSVVLTQTLKPGWFFELCSCKKKSKEHRLKPMPRVRVIPFR
jgi:hypothetical protein